ncbi:unnamed protein product [Mytilus coruscus]|uniref:Uncharacterized protein n=1 Tax=Mytilus coruscus TaxID=42192 RepID=A0A6J8CXM5_MYTCO|nr:unnamed protein product [Mytilus coruscus]
MGEYSVCPNQRYSLGIRWRRSSTLCGHPDHTGKSKPESDRAVMPQISHHLLRTRGVVVPIGSGLCRNCRQIINKEMEESKWPNFEICDAPSRANHLEDATDLETIEEPVTKRPRREIVSCFDTLGLNEVSSQSEPALSQGSSWSQTSEGQQQLSSGIHVLNEQIVNLSTGNTSPIKYQLQQPLECVQDSTKRYLKRKATEVILTMLHYIAPGQSSALFQWLMDDCKMSKGLKNQSQDQLMTLIIRLYEEAENNTLKIQLLSLISSSNFNSKSDLQQLIPGLSKWKIDQSRDHSAHCGAGNIPANKGKVFRDRMDNEKLEHCLSFFLDPNFIQICSYGTKDICFDNGDIITIPQVVRTACHSTLINMYKKVCSETTFTPLSDSTLFKILSTCASAKRSNLSGLDNIATDGTFAVDSLLRVTDTLRELRADTAILSTISAALKSLKLYLKSEYKFSISQSDICGTHCIKHALSKPGNLLLQDSCDHSHENSCQKCKLLTEAKFKLNNEVQKIESPDIKEDLENSINIDFEKVTEWQAHVLRTNNQEECRLKLLDELDKHQLLIVMDWAMKCLPLLYREKQSDFFGQKGMSWHVSVAIFRAEDKSLKHRNWFAVASALEHTLTTIKEQMPQIQEVFLRSDNAGCYHCGCLWLSLHGISERTGIRVTRYDFSEAQSGKSICDAKIAHMRLKMRMYVSSGRNITSPFRNAGSNNGWNRESKLASVLLWKLTRQSRP